MSHGEARILLLMFCSRSRARGQPLAASRQPFPHHSWSYMYPNIATFLPLNLQKIRVGFQARQLCHATARSDSCSLMYGDEQPISVPSSAPHWSLLCN